jgi:hypothetical protein
MKLNLDTIERMRQILSPENSEDKARMELDSILEQARGMSFDYDEGPWMSACETDDRHLSNISIEDIVNSLLWQKWIETASNSEILNEAQCNPHFKEWLESLDQE